MGQLEKYGLYVLVLLAFLIIGVAIWGEPARPAGGRGPGNGALNAPAGQPGKPAPGKQPGNPAATANGGNGTATTPPATQGEDLARALQRAPVVEPKKGNEPVKAGGQTPGVDPAKDPKHEVALDTQPREHKVRTGETFERIAREQLGDPRMASEIARLNPKLEPTRVRAGQTIVLPSRAEVAKWKVARAPRPADAPAGDRVAAEPKAEKPAPASNTYTVARGDTIEGIAKRLLGDARRARQIQDLNPQVRPTSMKIGTVLAMPAK